MDSLTISILNFNGKYYLERCLKSVPILIAGTKLEKILIDNNSTDESWKIAEKYGFKVIHADNRNRFITGINTALKSFTQETILFSQADLEFKPQAFKHLCYHFSENPISVIQPVFLNQKERVENAGMDWVWPGYGLSKRKSGIKKLYPTDIVSSITFITSRKVIDKVGLFDDLFSPAYYEDVDFSLRCKKKRIKRLVAREAIVKHFHNSSFSKIYSKKYLSNLCYRNRQIVINKHYRGLNRKLRLLTTHVIQPLHSVLDASSNRLREGYSSQS